MEVKNKELTYLPKYVKLKNIALRLVGSRYYRDAGRWAINYKIIDGILLSWSWGMGTPHLHRQDLVEITEEEWRIGNGIYA